MADYARVPSSERADTSVSEGVDALLAFRERAYAHCNGRFIIGSTIVAVLLLTAGSAIRRLGYTTNNANIPKAPRLSEASDPEKSQHLAVCYSGQVRTFPAVYKQNADEIHGFDSRATTFFMLDKTDNYTTKSGRHVIKTHAEDEVNSLFKAFSVGQYEYYNTSDVRIAPGTLDCMYTSNDRIQYTEFHIARRCLEMVMTYEKATNTTFGWIARLQPNMELRMRKLPFNSTVRVHMSGYAAALVPRSQADYFFRADELFGRKNCKKIRDMDPDPCAKYSYMPSTIDCRIIRWLALQNYVPSNSMYIRRRVVDPS